MKTIQYDPIGIAFADFNIENKANEFLNSTETKIVVSTFNFINAVRAIVAEDRFDYRNVVFFYKEEEIYLNKYARFDKSLPGFYSPDIDLLHRILSSSINKK